jgi:hypothetical protein
VEQNVFYLLLPVVRLLLAVLKLIGCVGCEAFGFSVPLILLNLSAMSICSPMKFKTLSISIVLLFGDLTHSCCSLNGIILISRDYRSPLNVFNGTPSVSNALICDGMFSWKLCRAAASAPSFTGCRVSIFQSERR